MFFFSSFVSIDCSYVNKPRIFGKVTLCTELCLRSAALLEDEASPASVTQRCFMTPIRSL